MGNDNNTSAVAEDVNNNPVEPVEKVDKTYTQEDLNKEIKAQKKAITENLLKELGVKDFDSAKNGIKKYLEDVEKNKSELEKANDTINSNAAEIESLKSENNNLMFTNKALIAGVKSDNIADFVAIVNSRVNETTSADDVIKQLKENSAYNGFFNAAGDNPDIGTGSPIGQHKGVDGKVIDYGEYLANKFSPAQAKLS